MVFSGGKEREEETVIIRSATIGSKVRLFREGTTTGPEMYQRGEWLWRAASPLFSVVPALGCCFGGADGA